MLGCRLHATSFGEAAVPLTADKRVGSNCRLDQPAPNAVNNSPTRSIAVSNARACGVHMLRSRRQKRRVHHECAICSNDLLEE